MRASVAIAVAMMAVLAVPVQQSDASDPGFMASYEGIPQEELASLLGEEYVRMVCREALGTAGILASEDGPVKPSDMRMEDIRFGVSLSPSRTDSAAGDRVSASALYTYYIEFSFSLEAAIGSDAVVFDTEACGDAFGTGELHEGDAISISGRARSSGEADMRDTAVRQSRDGSLCAVESTSMVESSDSRIEMTVKTTGLLSERTVEVAADRSVSTVTVADPVYMSEEDSVEPGSEVYCRWTSREDSADISVSFVWDGGSHQHRRDVGDCGSGISHGAVSGMFFYRASSDVDVGSYSDAVSEGLREFVRGETLRERLRDDGLEPYREPQRYDGDLWLPAVSIIAFLALLVLSVRAMHDGLFRYRGPQGIPWCRRS